MRRIAAALVLGLLLWWPACLLTKWLADRTNRGNADELVVALNGYRLSRGRYPPNLDELAPGMVAEVARQERYPGLMRIPFIYITDELGLAFQLAYGDAPLGFTQPTTVHILDSFRWRWAEVPLE